MLTRRRLLGAGAGLGLAACAGPRRRPDSLLIYTDLVLGALGGHRGDWLLDAARQAGHQITLLQLSMSDLEARLREEQSAPQYDILLGFSPVLHEQQRAAGLLHPFTPSWAAALGSHDTTWPLTTEPVFMAYSLAAFPQGRTAPPDWPQLVSRPELTGRYEAPNGLEIVPELVIAALLYRYRQETGRHGVSDEGWQLLQQYYQNAKVVPAFGDFGQLKLGSLYLVLTTFTWWRTAAPQAEVETAAMIPEAGVAMLDRMISIRRSSPRIEAAVRFADWFGSPPVQSEYARRFHTIPVHPDATADPAIAAAARPFRAQPVDWSYVARHRSAWRQAISQYLPR